MTQVNTAHKLLTIAIPTFNRNQILLRNLERILPQMEDWVELLVVDNNSEVPVAETVRPLINQYPGIRTRIVRNSVNIGGNANVLRCVEYCETEYIWIVGDDDYPVEDALKKVHRCIRTKEAIWVNFYSPDCFQPKRDEGGVYQTFGGFLQALRSISELVFVSTNVYRTECIRSGLELGHLYQSMMAPHLVSMIAGIEKSAPLFSYHISRDHLFSSISNNTDVATSWPLYRAFIGITSLYQVPFSNDVAKHILRLIRGARSQWLSNREMISAFSSLSSRYGVLRSLLISSNFCVSLLIVDRLRVLVTCPIYMAAIAFGPYKRYVKSLCEKWFGRLFLGAPRQGIDSVRHKRNGRES